MVQRHLRLLGPVSVEQLSNPHGDLSEEPRFRSRRTVALLGYLAAEHRPVAREHLAARFWPDEVSSKARANLRRELHNLSRILPECWHLERHVVAFEPSTKLTVDIYSLIELENSERWWEAAELLRGAFLEGLFLDENAEFENWLHAEREQWRRKSESILIHIIQGFSRRGQYADALKYCQRFLQLSPWNEEIHRKVMQLLAWTGQRGAALRQFEICKHALWVELRVEPSTETIALYQQIRAGKVDIPPQLPAFLTKEEARHPYDRAIFVARTSELERLHSFLDAALAGDGQVVFITGGPGRGKTALMDAFARHAMDSYPHLLTATGNCYTYSGIGDPYLPFRDVLSMLTGDVESRWDAGAITRDHAQRLWAAFPTVLQALLRQSPQLVDALLSGKELLTRAMAMDQVSSELLIRLKDQFRHSAANSLGLEQLHLFQQVTNLLLSVAQEQPLIIFLDDMQWADTASCSLLFHLGRRLTEVHTRILIVCAYRPEEVALERAGKRHPLAKPLSEFKRTFGDVWIDLSQTDSSVGRKFVNALLDSQPNRLTEDFRAALFHRTEGHPLFTIELLRMMRERGDLFEDEQGYLIEGARLDWQLLPARVEAVIEERISRLDSLSQEILTIASIEGEVFTAQVIAEVQKIPERLSLRKLSNELERQHRLVSKEGEVQVGQQRLSRYRFEHVLFQDYLYKQIDSVERRLLHADVAVVLEQLYSGQLEEMAGLIARHYFEAQDFKNSFQYFYLAGERSARIFANDEAIRHYSRCVELAEIISLDKITTARVRRKRGLAYETLGELEQAQADLDTALGIAQVEKNSRLEWRILIDLGKLSASRDYEQTLGYFKRALELARQNGEPTELAVSLNRMGNWIANNEEPLQAIGYHQEALDIFEQLGNKKDIATTLDLLGIAHLLAGDYITSAKYYDRAIALFRDLDDRSGLISSLIGRGVIVSLIILLAMVAPDSLPNAHQDINEAVQIAHEIGSSPDEAWTSWALGLLHTLHGDFGSALKLIQDGIQIASKIGHREWLVGNLFALGVLYCELLVPEKALIELQRGLDLAVELRSQYWINHLTGAQATAHLLLGDLSSAQSFLDTVITSQTSMDTKGKRYCWAKQAELAFNADDLGTALEITDRLISTAPGMDPDHVITFLWLLKGRILSAMNSLPEAEPLLQAALINAQKIGERFLMWRVYAALGNLYHLTKRLKEEQDAIKASISLIEEMASTLPDENLLQNFRLRAYSTLEALNLHPTIDS